MNFAGLDIETTGTCPDKHHRLIQIGIALPNGFNITWDVYPIGDINICAKSMEINGFTLGRIYDAPLQTDVDAYISTELALQGYTHASLIPVGWNVGVFDMDFVKRELPETAKFFIFGHDEISAKCMDLNALAMFYAYKTGVPLNDFKKQLKAEAAKRLGLDKEHDALYDAKSALVILEILKEYL